MNPQAIAVVPIILAGGSGTRLWPLSRALHPKQFLSLGIGGEQTLFQQAAMRVTGLSEFGIDVRAPCIVANEEHRFTVVDQIQAIGVDSVRVLLEPCGRNTAPALTLAALEAQRLAGPEIDPVLVVCPADHAIADGAAFSDALRLAIMDAADGGIVVLGIKPDSPNTGYGYIRTVDAAAAKERIQRVEEFVEKPDRQTAERYVADGRYFWNSGMFIMRASTWLAELKNHRPDILAACEAARDKSSSDKAFLRFDDAAFRAIPGESIDYAVIEPTSKPGSNVAVKMVTLDAGWNDLGAWDAVWQVGVHDGEGNVAHGDAVLHDSRNTLVHATSRLVGVIGLDDISVVETPDAVLVAHRSSSADVKRLVSTLTSSKRDEAATHRRVHRPWGWYETIDRGPRFQVKRIMVKPGARLSLQMHHHRAEHWVVVSGTAEVTNGQKVTILAENESTFIPLGQKHRLANPGVVSLEIIEVQSGAYLGEDDIVRFEDSYGRA